MPDRTIIEARFGKSERRYDYFCDFPVEVGQRVYVPTQRGEAKVEVMAIKAVSDSASVAALRVVEQEQETDQ